MFCLLCYSVTLFVSPHIWQSTAKFEILTGLLDRHQDIEATGSFTEKNSLRHTINYACSPKILLGFLLLESSSSHPPIISLSQDPRNQHEPIEPPSDEQFERLTPTSLDAGAKYSGNALDITKV